MPLIDGLDKTKLPDIRRAKGCREWLYVGANRAMHKLRLRRITSGSPTTRPFERYNPLRCCRHEVVV